MLAVGAGECRDSEGQALLSLQSDELVPKFRIKFGQSALPGGQLLSGPNDIVPGLIGQ